MNFRHDGASVSPGQLGVSANPEEPGHLRLIGELDVGTRDALITVVDAPEFRARDVRVDASQLVFVDCAGLAVLLQLARRVRAEGFAFGVTRAGDALARLSALTHTRETLGVR
jgi:anti-anti-sigma factor